VLARSDSAGATHLFAAACRKEGWSSPSGSRSMSASRPSWIWSPPVLAPGDRRRGAARRRL